MRDIYYLFILFIMYSFIGYIIEIISVYKTTKKITFSRGYLIGPYLPIFGFGSIIIVNFLYRYSNDYFALFLAASTLTGILEYLTSYLMEKFFGLRWWDYSNSKYNINGRICLENLILFGLSGILILKIINPFLLTVVTNIPYTLIQILSIVLFVVIIIDFIISTTTIIKIKNNFKLFKNKDNTKEIREEIFKKLTNSTFLRKRLYNSFPKLRENILELINNTHYKNFQKKKEEAIKKIKYKHNEFKKNINNIKKDSN